MKERTKELLFFRNRMASVSYLTLFFALIAIPGFALAADLAISDVTVVNTKNGVLSPHRTVIIHDGRIASIGDSAPPGATTLNATGKFLIPGFWDMVTHLSWTRSSALPALVARGVTGVRDEGGDLSETANWAAEVRAGKRLGPTILQVGPMLNGRSFNQYQYALGSPEQARGAVRLLKFEGVDGLEIERRVARDEFFALLDEAKAQGLPVGGKVPLDVTPAEASMAGQATIDNLETIYDGRFRAAHANDMAGAMDAFLKPKGESETLFALLARNGTAVTPCLAAFAGAITQNDPAAAHNRTLRYVAKSQRIPPKAIPPEERDEFKRMLPRLAATTARLAASGVVILAGTDIAGNRIPGFSLHEELDALSAAGLTPLRVLQTATLQPAIVMHLTADYGTVEVGRIADLVLLDADPTESTKALHGISAVILHGRFLNGAALMSLLNQSAQEAERE